MINKLKLTDNNCVCVKQKLNKPLIYLRGLEVAELKEEDMPMVYILFAFEGTP